MCSVLCKFFLRVAYTICLMWTSSASLQACYGMDCATPTYVSGKLGTVRMENIASMK